MKRYLIAVSLFVAVALSCMVAEARFRPLRAAGRAVAAPVRLVRHVQPIRRVARAVARVQPVRRAARVVAAPVRLVRHVRGGQ